MSSNDCRKLSWIDGKKLFCLEGSAVGKIEWKFNFESCGAAVSQIQVRCPFTVYENGTVQWFLCDENNCQKIPDGK